MKKKSVLVLGYGNVGKVAVAKMRQFPDIFSSIIVASHHTANTPPGIIEHITYAEDVERLKAVIDCYKPDLVMNLLPPFYNLNVMLACLSEGVDYLDTACFEEKHILGFSNSLQLKFGPEYKQKGIRALLQCGFDPGATNFFTAYLLQSGRLDTIESLDILDCNAGRKDSTWTTNFDPEVNIRELILPIRSILNRRWRTHGRLIDEDAIHFPFDFPEAGKAEAYLMYHEELESLSRSFPGIKRLRFWMTFSQDYLTHLRVIHNMGLDSIEPLDYSEDGKNMPVTPLLFLKGLMPRGKDFNHTYRGRTCIGCIAQGKKAGRTKTYYIYQVCDHRQAFEETGGNAIGYTTAIPAVIGAMLMLHDQDWIKPGVHVPEKLNATKFLQHMEQFGLPFKVRELPGGLPEFLRKDFEGKKAKV